jgi:hypothetical protein
VLPGLAGFTGRFVSPEETSTASKVREAQVMQSK